MQQILLHADPSRISEGRMHVTRMLLAEKRTWHAEVGERDHIGLDRGGPDLWVQDMARDGSPTHWRPIHDAVHGYAYRCILPNQVVFDMGDHGDWRLTAREVDAVSMVLARWRVPHWVSLSGGRGVHVETFIQPTWCAQYRETFFRYTLAHASDLMGDDIWVEAQADELFIDPRPDSRVLREFGVRGVKGAVVHRKTLWSEGAALAPRLPADPEDAYRQAGQRFPTFLPIAIQPPGVFHRSVRDAFGGPCPRDEDTCFDPYSPCSDCPMGR